MQIILKVCWRGRSHTIREWRSKPPQMEDLCPRKNCIQGRTLMRPASPGSVIFLTH